MLEVGHPWGTVLTGGERSHGGAHCRRTPRGRAAPPASGGCLPSRKGMLAMGEQAEAAARRPGELLAKGPGASARLVRASLVRR